ncbi:superoxide dismutase [Alteromonas lipolytica]|uniref:Superoxide dismutase n=1 Tax=Alteromonas lipolytica TaxID=1856405 RepID=A0A1E8F8P4_9ALTE|nr:Fe-Mn family superoxide dismutase [Alteromonas lipolytica]OFI32289.1 superoxide dismutase [Alteromonas lipolytica]GGF85774.1 superoxide dismutase [Alteromonas lipolytica]
MKITLPELPYAMDALAPHMSQETLEYHYGKHHATYVNKLNDLIADTEFADADLETIIANSSGPLFNNAAQVWNHTFFWHCLTPNGGGEPPAEIKAVIEENWESVEAFKDAFTLQAINNFGSGWTWLALNAAGELVIVNTANANTPIAHEGLKPLLTVDVWEHAYYIDHRNARPAYLDAFWQLVNWDFALTNLTGE